jgi:serine protease inhibitor
MVCCELPSRKIGRMSKPEAPAGDALAAAVAASNALAARWAANLDGGSDSAFSTASLWPLTACLAASADGPARVELEQAAGVPADGAESLAAVALDQIRASDAVRAATALWVSDDVPLHDWWQTHVAPEVLQRLTGNLETDQAAYDNWVRTETGGLIDAMPGVLTEDTLLALAASVCVRSKWLEPFRVGMMIPQSGPWAKQRLFSCARSGPDLENLRVVDSPAGLLSVASIHGTGDVTVELVLGTEEAEPAAVLAAAVGGTEAMPTKVGSEITSADGAPGVMVGLHRSKGGPQLAIEVPRFSVESDHNLLDHKDLFGLQAATDASQGHFPLLSDYPLAIGSGRQRTMANFTELGFEAASVSAYGAVAGGVPPLDPQSIGVLFAHPFGFIARLRTSGMVLVAGWVAIAPRFDRSEIETIQLG